MNVVDRSQKKTFGSFKMSLRLEKAGSHTKLATLGLACLNKPGQWGLSLILTIHSLLSRFHALFADLWSQFSAYRGLDEVIFKKLKWMILPSPEMANFHPPHCPFSGSNCQFKSSTAEPCLVTMCSLRSRSARLPAYLCSCSFRVRSYRRLASVGYAALLLHIRSVANLSSHRMRSAEGQSLGLAPKSSIR